MALFPCPLVHMLLMRNELFKEAWRRVRGEPDQGWKRAGEHVRTLGTLGLGCEVAAVTFGERERALPGSGQEK